MEDKNTKGPAIDTKLDAGKSNDLGAGDKPIVAPPVETQTDATDDREPLDRAIDRWVHDHIHNSGMSRDTPAYNHLISVLPQLKSLIEEETKA